MKVECEDQKQRHSMLWEYGQAFQGRHVSLVAQHLQGDALFAIYPVAA